LGERVPWPRRPCGKIRTEPKVAAVARNWRRVDGDTGDDDEEEGGGRFRLMSKE
jgi:hypothetical protein